MRRSISPRRVFALAASAALAAGLAGLPASPASAQVLWQLETQAFADAGSSCPLTSGTGSDDSTSPIFSSGTKSKSASFSGTFTNTGDPTDTVQASGHYKGTLTVHKQGKDLKNALLSGTGAVSLDVAKGNSTGCDPEAQSFSIGQFQFTEHHAGWFFVKRTTPAKPNVSETELVNQTTNTAVQFELFQGGKSVASTRGFSKAGTFTGELGIGVIAGDTGIAKSPPRSTLSVQFVKAGSSLAGTKGAGAAYVEFPSSVSCGTHKATLRWKPSASKVAAGVFFVNGQKKASDSTPRGGEKIVLSHLSPKADIKISTKLQLKGGGSALASRSYVPCKG